MERVNVMESRCGALGSCHLKKTPPRWHTREGRLADPLPHYAALVVLRNRNVAVFLFLQEPYS
jgi:hypothetical protein